MGAFLQSKVDFFAESLEEAFEMLPRAPDQAYGEQLDNIAEQVTGICRTVGEDDDSYRRRISESLTLDEDARFAAKVESALKEWDAEDKEEEP